MGSPLGPLLANTFMCSIEDKLEQENKIPSFYKRYVDDTLVIMSNAEMAHHFLTTLNCCHENLKFTMELAVENKITFLGMLIEKTGNQLETSVYQPTQAYFFIIIAM